MSRSLPPDKEHLQKGVRIDVLGYIGPKVNLFEKLMYNHRYCPCINCETNSKYYFDEKHRCPFDAFPMITILRIDTINSTGNVLTGASQNQEIESQAKICKFCRHISIDIFFGNFSDKEPVYYK